MLTFFIYSLISLVTCTPFAYSVYRSLTPKWKSWKGLMGYSLCIFVTLTVKLYFDMMYYTSMITLVLTQVVLYTLMYIFTTDPWTRVLKYYLLLTSAMVLSDLFCAMVFYLNGMDLQSATTHVPTPMVRLFSSISVVIFMFAAILLWNKLSGIAINTTIWQFGGVLGLQLIICSMFLINLATFESKISILKVVAFTGVAWLITDLFFIKSIIDNHQKAQLQLSLDQAMQLEKMQYEYYENLTESIDSLRKYRHDMSNTLQTLSMVINSPDTVSNGRELFAQTLEEFKATQIPYYCGNPVINAVIVSKKLSADEIGAKMDISVKCEEAIGIRDIDLCSIFSNLLDNAVEAVTAAGGGEINISSWTDSGYFFVKSVNSYDKNIKQSGKKFVSTKGKDRGMGLSIIESIAKKYGGSVVIDPGEMFSVLAALKVG